MSITYFLCRQCGAEWLGQELSSDPFANMVNAVMVELCAKCQEDRPIGRDENSFRDSTLRDSSDSHLRFKK